MRQRKNIYVIFFRGEEGFVGTKNPNSSTDHGSNTIYMSVYELVLRKLCFHQTNGNRYLI